MTLFGLFEVRPPPKMYCIGKPYGSDGVKTLSRGYVPLRFLLHGE